jgi:hypothetical protein
MMEKWLFNQRLLTGMSGGGKIVSANRKRNSRHCDGKVSNFDNILLL